MTIPRIVRSSEIGFKPALAPRSCQTCHTTVTSQWRYGLSGNVLLCNACGIRWKRKNQMSGKKRLKPGPKRIRYRSSISRHMQSFPLQKSFGSILQNSNVSALSHKNLSSSSSVTDNGLENISRRELLGSVDQKVGHSTLPSCPKMDIGQLVSPSEGYTKSNFQMEINTKLISNARSSPISIRSLLNFTDEDVTQSSCSSRSSLVYKNY